MTGVGGTDIENLKTASQSPLRHVIKPLRSMSRFVLQDTGGVVYGTDNGTIGHVSPSGPSQLRKTWELPGGGDMGKGVTTLRRYDLTQDGVAELIAGRDDGTVTVRHHLLFSMMGHSVHKTRFSGVGGAQLSIALFRFSIWLYRTQLALERKHHSYICLKL